MPIKGSTAFVTVECSFCDGYSTAKKRDVDQRRARTRSGLLFCSRACANRYRVGHTPPTETTHSVDEYAKPCYGIFQGLVRL